MRTRRRYLHLVTGATFLLAGCSESSPSQGSTPESEDSGTEVSIEEVETVSETPDCSNPDEQSRLVVTTLGLTADVATREAAESFIERFAENSDAEAVIVEVEDGEYAVEVRSDPVPVDEVRQYADDHSDFGPIRAGLTEVTLTKMVDSISQSLDQADEVTDFSIYRLQPGDSEPDRIVAILSIEGAEGLSPSEKVTFYAEADGERQTVVDKSLFEVTNIEEEQENMIGVYFELNEAGRQQFRQRLTEMVDIENGARDALAIEVGEEIVWEGGLSPMLGQSIQSGEWDGSFKVVFKNEDVASTFTNAVNLLQLPIPAETSLERC